MYVRRQRVISKKITGDAEILRDRDGGHCGVRCDNRVLLRESGAQSDIPPLYAVVRSTSRGKTVLSIAESSLDHIIIPFR